MTFSQLLGIVRARWMAGAAALLLAVLVATAHHVMSEAQYTANASVIVDLKSPDPAAAAQSQGQTSLGYLATQVDVIRSQRAASTVIDLLRLREDAALKARWQDETGGSGSFDAWAIRRLGANLDVRPSRGSNVINIAFTDRDPEVAARTADAFVQAYIDLTVSLRVDPAKQYAEIFDARARQIREQLEQAQAKLSAFQREHGILATDERLDIETSRLNELSSQLVALQATAAESGGRQLQAAGNADRMSEVINSPVVSALTADLARLESRYRELTSRLGDRHPQVVEARESIAEMRRRISIETNRISGSLAVANNINQSRVNQLQNALKQQRATVLKMRELRDQAAILLRDVDSAQRAYDGVLARGSATSLESEVRQANVARLGFASIPTTPTSMGLRKRLAIALAFGAVLALALISLLERRDRRLRGEDDVTRELGLTLVATLPNFGPSGLVSSIGKIERPPIALLESRS